MAVVFWMNPRFDRHHEVFESREDAMAAATQYAAEFPWNTYYVAEVVHTFQNTQPRENGLEPAPSFWSTQL